MAEEKMRVLGLGAHPDDMEWMCGGTMAKFARLGHEVFLCHVSNGNKGSFRYASQLEWVAQRGEDDMMEDFKVVSRLRGMQCGVKYAEAFRVCPTAARAVPYRVLP